MHLTSKRIEEFKIVVSIEDIFELVMRNYPVLHQNTDFVKVRTNLRDKTHQYVAPTASLEFIWSVTDE